MKLNRGRRVVAIMIVTIVAVAVTEGAIRLVRLIPDNASIPYVEVPGDEGFAPRPSASGTSILGITSHTDALGLRGPDRAPSVDSRTVRVALVGDSVVWGWGLEDDDTISSSLERLASEGGHAVQAWNLGVQAHNTFNERARYERFAPLLSPHVSVVVVLFNDLEGRPARLRVTASGALANPHRRAPYPDALRPLVDRSALFWAAFRIYGSLLPSRDEQFSMANMPLLLGQLDRIRATATRNRSDLVVAAMPGMWPDHEHFAEFSAQLAGFCRERSVRFVDLTIALGNPPARQYFLSADSAHPTAEGSRRIAKVLLPIVLGSVAEQPGDDTVH